MEAVCGYCNKNYTPKKSKNKYCSKLCRTEGFKVSRTTNHLRKENYRFYKTYNGAKFRAKENGVIFTIKFEDVYMFPEYCPVLNIKLKFGENGKALDESPSIDRIDPNLGYIKENVRVISFRANALKSNATVEELKLIYEDALKIKNLKDN